MDSHPIASRGDVPAFGRRHQSFDVFWREPVADVRRPRVHWAGKPFRKRALIPVSRPSGLRSRRAQVSPHLFFIQYMGGHALHYNNTEKRQNRRSNGTSAGEKADCDERSRSEQTSFSPATGDQPIACRSAANQRDRISGSASASLRLCVFAGWADGWALRSLRFKNGQVRALRLRVSAPLRFSWCSPLVSWCLGGSKTTQYR